jgi:hypothetical protein
MSEAAPGKKMLGRHSSDPELPKESFVHQLSAFWNTDISHRTLPPSTCTSSMVEETPPKVTPPIRTPAEKRGPVVMQRTMPTLCMELFRM